MPNPLLLRRVLNKNTTPIALSSPVITGVPFAGGELLASTGTWLHNPSSFVYKWYKNGTLINGATSSLYPIVLGDENATITCSVTAVNKAGSSAENSSSGVLIGANSMLLDFSSMATTSVNTTFATSDVDIPNNKLNITAFNFSYIDMSQAVRVYFSSTGTLPAPLQENTPYFLKNVTGGVRAYRCNDDSHYSSIAGFMQGESIPMMLEYGLDIPVVITDTGSGVHTMRTGDLLANCVDKSGNGHGYTETAYNRLFEIGTDAKGKYLDMLGVTGVSLSALTAPYYGSGYTLGGGGLASGQKRASKVSAGFIMAGILKATPMISQKRIILTSANVNSSTGLFTTTGNNGHGITTGSKVEFGAFPAGVFPSGISAGTKYARNVSSSTFTLHPTLADATNNTNVITYTDSGSGKFYVVVSSEVSVSNRQMLFDICQAGNDHHFSPQTAKIGKIIDFASIGNNMAIWLPGNQTSDSNGAFGLEFNLSATEMGNNWTVLQCHLFVPSGSVGWTRFDTGQPMTGGDYWITRDPDTPTWFRMHDTYNNALANVGVRTRNATCIKFPSTANAVKGSGFGEFHLVGKTCFRTFNDAFNIDQNALNMVDIGDEGIFTLLRDYAGNGTYRKLYAGKNSLTSLINGGLTNESSGVSVAGTSNSYIILGDAAEYHVPGAAKIRYALITFGSNLAQTQAQMQMAVDYLKQKYGY